MVKTKRLFGEDWLRGENNLESCLRSETSQFKLQVRGIVVVLKWHVNRREHTAGQIPYV